MRNVEPQHAAPFSPDHLFRGEKLPGQLVRLLWNHPSPELVQLLQGGDRDVRGLRPSRLHGPAVPPDRRRVPPRVSERHRLQWLHPVLPPCGESMHDISKRGKEQNIHFPFVRLVALTHSKIWTAPWLLLDSHILYIHFSISLNSKRDPLRWGSTRDSTSKGRCTSWLTTATPFKINVTCRTCSPATWWTATGWCSSCPTLRARCFYPRPGQYKNLREISSDDMRFSSIKRITLTDWQLRNKKQVGALFLILKLWFVHCLHCTVCTEFTSLTVWFAQ